MFYSREINSAVGYSFILLIPATDMFLSTKSQA